MEKHVSRNGFVGAGRAEDELPAAAAEDRVGRLLRALGPEWRTERGLDWSGAPPPWYLKCGGLVYCSAPGRELLFRGFAEARSGRASPRFLDMFPVPAALRGVRSEEELELLLEAYGF